MRRLQAIGHLQLVGMATVCGRVLRRAITAADGERSLRERSILGTVMAMPLLLAHSVAHRTLTRIRSAASARNLRAHDMANFANVEIEKEARVEQRAAKSIPIDDRITFPRAAHASSEESACRPAARRGFSSTGLSSSIFPKEHGAAHCGVEENYERSWCIIVLSRRLTLGSARWSLVGSQFCVFLIEVDRGVALERCEVGSWCPREVRCLPSKCWHRLGSALKLHWFRLVVLAA